MAKPYQVWCPTYGILSADAITQLAGDAEEAAVKWAAHRERAQMEFPILNGEPVVVRVKAFNGTVTMWEVSGESVAEYRATEVK